MAILEAVINRSIGLTHVLLTIALLYGGVLLYRVYFSPLSKFPGPKLAAASSWYEFYYEFIYKGGSQFAFHIDELHQEYGTTIKFLHQDPPTEADNPI